MGQSYHYNNQQLQQLQQQPQTGGSSRWGVRASSGRGEIVQVQGGHIVRSTSRKDRHSKVCTAKGARDRRVRLSAHTAIQFYDVQDRLGFDRPSKAVDWLIEKAKSAIDKLAELPPWKPTATTVTNMTNSPNATNFDQNQGQLLHPIQRSQDLRLSLQSLQDPILHNHHYQQQTQQDSVNNNNIYFDGSGWSENQPDGFVFSSQALFGQTLTGSELFNNSREPLQSSTTTPSFRAWNDPLPPFSGVSIDQHSTLGFGFGFPGRIGGGEEEHDHRPSSASSE